MTLKNANAKNWALPARSNGRRYSEPANAPASAAVTLASPTMTSDGASVAFSGGAYTTLIPQWSTDQTNWNSLSNDTATPFTFTGVTAGSTLRYFRALSDGTVASNVVSGYLTPTVPTVTASRINDTTIRFTLSGGINASTWTANYRTPSSSGLYTQASLTVGQDHYDVTVSSQSTADFYPTVANAGGSVDGSVVTGSAAPSSAVTLSLNTGSGGYESSVVTAAIAFPIDANIPSWSWVKNPHPGVEWSVRIAIRGGARPWNISITNDGGATGLTCHGVYDGVTDTDTGKTIYSMNKDTYAWLKWASPPSSGTFNFQITAVDQEGTTLTIPITGVTPSASGWVVIDPVSGNDSTGSGTLADPFKTTYKLHGGTRATTTYAQKKVLIRGDGGTTALQLDGMTDANPQIGIYNYGIDGTTHVPVQFFGYPGENAILEQYQGWFALNSGVPNFALQGLTVRYASAFSPGGANAYPIYMITCFSQVDNLYIAGNIFKDFKGTPGNFGVGNSAIIFCGADGGSNICVANNKLAGTTGVFIDQYKWTNFVVEGNGTLNTPSVVTEDGSAHAIIFLKDSPRNFTVAENDFWDVTWTNQNIGGITIYGQAGAFNGEICYNTVRSPHSTGNNGAFADFMDFDASGDFQNVNSYRNSMKQRFKCGANSIANTTYGPGQHKSKRNVLDTGTFTASNTAETYTDNVDSTTYFDTSMKLLTAKKSANLGVRGREIAQ